VGAADRDPLLSRIDPELREAFGRKVGVHLSDVGRARATLDEGCRAANAARTPNPGVARADVTVPGRADALARAFAAGRADALARAFAAGRPA